jgi:hypothetical protein
MSDEGLESLRARVNDDPQLARRLRRIESDRFVAEAARVAVELGLDVSEDDLREAVARGQQSWAMRWVR